MQDTRTRRRRSEAREGPRGAQLWSRLGWIVPVLVALALGFSLSGSGGSVAELRWIHPNPENIATFKVFSTTDPEKKEENIRSQNVGRPAREEIFAWPIELSESGPVWVAVSAVDRNGVESVRTRWRRLEWKDGVPGLEPPGKPYLVR